MARMKSGFVRQPLWLVPRIERSRKTVGDAAKLPPVSQNLALIRRRGDGSSAAFCSKATGAAALLACGMSQR